MTTTTNDWNGWLEAIDDLVTQCAKVPPEGAGFASSVRDQALSMASWIRTNRKITENQKRAIENWLVSISNWLE